MSRQHSTTNNCKTPEDSQQWMNNTAIALVMQMYGWESDLFRFEYGKLLKENG